TLFYKILTVPVPSPSARRQDLAPELEAICLKALAKKPGDRHPTMRDLVAALTAYLGKDRNPLPPEAGAARPEPPPPREDSLPWVEPLPDEAPSPQPRPARRAAVAGAAITCPHCGSKLKPRSIPTSGKCVCPQCRKRFLLGVEPDRPRATPRQ